MNKTRAIINFLNGAFKWYYNAADFDKTIEEAVKSEQKRENKSNMSYRSSSRSQP